MIEYSTCKVFAFAGYKVYTFLSNECSCCASLCYTGIGPIFFARDCRLISTFSISAVGCFRFIKQNNVGPDETPYLVASHVGLHCLSISYLYLFHCIILEWYLLYRVVGLSQQTVQSLYNTPHYTTDLDTTQFC